jgi:putative membrane protein
VWLLVLAIAAAYVAVHLRSPVPVSRREREDRVARRWRIAAFKTGLVVLWLALDWPIGALGAGYLASVHMLQYLLIALLAPALLLLGVPTAAYRRLGAVRGLTPIIRFVTHPLAALAVFNVILFYTHVPSVVDGLMRTQAGSFAIDMLWLAGGVVFWWPVVAPVPERPRFSYPVKMGYLFLATVLNTMPYAFLTFGELPFYGIYELAPPVAGISARDDQQIAGLLMKIGGGVILWTAITIIFFRWYRKEGDEAAWHHVE